MTRTTKSTKIYEIIGRPGGMVSLQSRHYDGDIMIVAAKSSRQALYLSGHSMWAEEPGEVGIIASYNRNQGESLWCGCGPYHPHKFRKDAPGRTKTYMQDHLEEVHGDE